MPIEFYTIVSQDILSLKTELNRILDSISRRLNNIVPDGENISLGGKKITGLAAGVSNSDGVRLDQALLLDNLAAIILGTSNRILITDNLNNTITIDIVEAGVDHNLLKNLTAGNVHTQYVLKSGSITQITTRVHSDLQTLTADDHSQYLLLAGRAGGQAITNTAGLTIGIGADYAEFEPDGTLVFNGAATIWKDIDFPIIIRTTGANKPVLTTIQGNLTMPLWLVNDYNVCETQELVHEWKEGSAGYWHCHIITSAAQATDAYTKWEIEYLILPESGTMAGSNTTVSSGDVLIPAGTAAGSHFLVPIHIHDLTGFKIADHIKARLKRVASAGATPTGGVFCEMLQMHIECDTVGSRLISTK